MFPIRENEPPIDMSPEAGQERDSINAAFDNFFEIIEQNETDQGTMLFSKLGRDADPFEGNEAEREEVRRQMDAVKEVRDDQGRLLAPNGKPSNLPEFLWKAVRTPFFKRWFGDWEAVAKKQTILLQQSRSIKVNEERSDRQALFLESRDRFGGKKVFNASFGDDIEITGRGLKHIKATSGDVRKAQALTKADEILANGIYVGSEPNKSSDANIKQYHRLATKVNINGDPLIVESVIRETHIGELLYDWGLTEVKPVGISNEVSASGSSLRPATSFTPSKLLQNILNVNENDVSKVVDENGEPMVVYHGTGADFDSFDFQRTSDAKLSSGKGAYLTTSPKAAGLYSLGISWGNAGGVEGQPNVIPAFVSIVKPFDKNADYRLSDMINIPELDDKRREIERENAPAVESYYDEIEQLQDFLHDLETGDPVDLVERYGREIGRIYEEDYEQGREDEDYIRDAEELVRDEIERTAKAIGRNEKQIEAAYADSREAIRKATLKGYQIWDSVKEALPSWGEYQTERNLFGGDVDALEFDTEVAEILNDAYGFDGIKRRDKFPLNKAGEHHTVYIANRSPNQIKSIFNRGTYSESGTMLFSKLGRDTDPFEGDKETRAEVRRQMDAVKEVRDKDGRLLAPNGKASDLPEHLWKAVRTPFFKRYAGEWELMQKTVPVLRSEPLSLGSLNEATRWAKSNLVGSYKNVDTGQNIAVSGNAISKYLSQKATDKSSSIRDHINALPSLPKLIETAVLADMHPDNKRNPAVKEVQRFYGALQTADGSIQRVKLTVKVYTGRNLAYTYEVSDIETLGGSSAVAGEESVISNRTPSVSMATLLQGARKNNGDLWDTTYTKVLDENGEPKIMYHGTNMDFTGFNPDLVGLNFDDASAGFYFTDSPELAATYANDTLDDTAYPRSGANVMPVFLNVRKPMLIQDTEPGRSSESYVDHNGELIAVRDSGGIDGAIVRTEGGRYSSTVAVAFDPNQIKSIFNRGTYSESGNMLFKKRSKEAAELLRSLATAHTQDILEGTRSNFEGDDLYLNEHASEEVRRLLATEAYNFSGEEREIDAFGGAVIDAPHLRAL